MSDFSTLAALLRDGQITREDFVALAPALQRGAEQYSYQPLPSILAAPAPRLNLLPPMVPPRPSTLPESVPDHAEEKKKETVVSAALRTIAKAPPPAQVNVFRICVCITCSPPTNIVSIRY